MVVVTNFISTFRECFNLSFLSANINWLTFPNTITWSIPKLTNVRHLQCCKGFQTSWFLNVCPFVVGKNFLVISSFSLGTFAKLLLLGIFNLSAILATTLRGFATQYSFFILANWPGMAGLTWSGIRFFHCWFDLTSPILLKSLYSLL